MGDNFNVLPCETVLLKISILRLKLFDRMRNGAVSSRRDKSTFVVTSPFLTVSRQGTEQRGTRAPDEPQGYLVHQSEHRRVEFVSS